MKNCSNCVYRDLLITQEPCMNCKYTEYWEEDKQEDEDNENLNKNAN